MLACTERKRGIDESTKGKGRKKEGNKQARRNDTKHQAYGLGEWSSFLSVCSRISVLYCLLL
jgi:hypothetical protein